MKGGMRGFGCKVIGFSVLVNVSSVKKLHTCPLQRIHNAQLPCPLQEEGWNLMLESSRAELVSTGLFLQKSRTHYDSSKDELSHYQVGLPFFLQDPKRSM